ncbi:MAG: sigma-54 dependent transcriptional regulator [Thermodesulfovibrionales bacterium]
MIRILVVDDEEPLRRLLAKELGRKGYAVETAADGTAALDVLRKKAFDIILLDIMMPGIDGISVLKKVKHDPAAPEVIVLTGKATVETAVDAMKNGAFDYLAKPYKLDELVIVVNRAFEFGRMRSKTRMLEQELVRQEASHGFVYRSRQMKEILDLVKKIAPADSTVFIQGESGTGKELVANTIWRLSRRKSLPLVALNCATLSENLIESELFGHEKGAFTSAYQMKHGLVEVADQGTLFLDEIAELPLGLQAKLLRFLDSGEFRRVGGTKTLTVNVRVIAATNKDLRELTAAGKFREDLFYRLTVINITIPPIRDRRDDIAVLAEHFMALYGRKLEKPVRNIGRDALGLLERYDWPGNVREIENVIERAVIICDGEEIQADDLSMPYAAAGSSRSAPGSLEEMEREHILRVLREAEGNQSRASQMLGIDRKTLYLKIRKYGLQDCLRK